MGNRLSCNSDSCRNDSRYLFSENNILDEVFSGEVNLLG